MSEEIVQQLISRLGNDEFVSATDLFHKGIFGSRSSLRQALINGTFPLVKISQNRTLIPRQAVEDFIRNGFREATL